MIDNDYLQLRNACASQLRASAELRKGLRKSYNAGDTLTFVKTWKELSAADMRLALHAHSLINYREIAGSSRLIDKIADERDTIQATLEVATAAAQDEDCTNAEVASWVKVIGSALKHKAKHKKLDKVSFSYNLSPTRKKHGKNFHVSGYKIQAFADKGGYVYPEYWVLVASDGSNTYLLPPSKVFQPPTSLVELASPTLSKLTDSAGPKDVLKMLNLK